MKAGFVSSLLNQVMIGPQLDRVAQLIKALDIHGWEADLDRYHCFSIED